MTVQDVSTVESKIADEKIAYLKSKKFSEWLKNFTIRELKKAVAEGLTTEKDIDEYMHSEGFNAKIHKAMKNKANRVEKQLREKYSAELRVLAIIRKMPRYDNSKIVIDL